jgi:hypothetical protein
MDNIFYLKDSGFSKINVTGELLKDIEGLYFDMCNYFCIILQDSKLDINEENFIEFKRLLKDGGSSQEVDVFFQKLLLEVNRKQRKLLGKLYDIGTRPMKLLSGENIFHNEEIQKIISDFFFEDRPLLVKPSNGETMHIFPPGPENFKYNLPIHQDFPYLMQSPSQLTFWLNLTQNTGKQSGGVRIYPGTHKLFVPRTRKDENGHFEVETESYAGFDRNKYVDSVGSQFELYAIDSLTWHSSNRNISDDSVRLTYIFRVSNIGSQCRVKYGLDALHNECPDFNHNDFAS